AIAGRAPWAAGPTAFTDAAKAAAQRAGVAVRTGAAVNRIDVRDDVVHSVELEGGEAIAARAVLSTAAPARTLLDWVDPGRLDPDFRLAVRNSRHRGCTAFALYALDSLPELPGLDEEARRGTVSLTPGLEILERAADAGKYGGLAERPHVELTFPTVTWPGD